MTILTFMVWKYVIEMTASNILNSSLEITYFFICIFVLFFIVIRFKLGFKFFNMLSNFSKKYHRVILIVMGFLIVILLIICFFIHYSGGDKTFRINVGNIVIKNGIVDLDSMTFEQKLAQMIIVRGDREDLGFNRLGVGGIFLDRQNSEEDYRSLIKKYQDNSKLKLFVSTDLEGAWTPFHNPEPHQVFPHFSDINSREEAFNIGLEHGLLLRSIGFNINFAPVSEYFDETYGGRVFLGNKEEISEKISFYISGLQQNVFGTCKHYPGKAMNKNLHYFSDKQVVSKDDLDLFEVCYESNISSVMVSHQIVSGEVNSEGVPSSVSEAVISSVDDSVLVIADEINMKALSQFYSDKTELYIDLINAGNDLILDFDLDSNDLYDVLENLNNNIERINISRVNESVIKILELKGYEVSFGKELES